MPELDPRKAREATSASEIPEGATLYDIMVAKATQGLRNKSVVNIINERLEQRRAEEEREKRLKSKAGP